MRKMKHSIIVEESGINGRGRKITIDGVTYPSLSSCPVNPSNVSALMKKKGYTFEEAADEILCRQEERNLKKQLASQQFNDTDRGMALGSLERKNNDLAVIISIMNSITDRESAEYLALQRAWNLINNDGKEPDEEILPTEKAPLLGISEETAQTVVNFRDQRNWKQFHNPKDLAISISLEASELLEVFQWSGIDTHCEEKMDKIREELADVANYCVLMASACGISLDEIIREKVQRNAKKYPIDKAYGKSTKYTEL